MFIYIYKLIKKGAINDDMVYIGSTKDIIERWRIHILRCKDEKNSKHHLKVYKYIRENGGIDEWEMIIIDEIEVPLDECEQRDKCEDEYIRRYDAINKLNGIYNRRTNRQYYEDNLEKLKEINKKWKIENKELIKEQSKAYYINNREKCNTSNKIRYYNKRENDKEYFIKVNEKRTEKICCDICKSIIRKIDLRRHQTSKKCINFKNLTI